MKGVYEIWGDGSSYEELKEAVNSLKPTTLNFI